MDVEADVDDVASAVDEVSAVEVGSGVVADEDGDGSTAPGKSEEVAAVNVSALARASACVNCGTSTTAGVASDVVCVVDSPLSAEIGRAHV